jgi:hypothetical protein
MVKIKDILGGGRQMSRCSRRTQRITVGTKGFQHPQDLLRTRSESAKGRSYRSMSDAGPNGGLRHMDDCTILLRLGDLGKEKATRVTLNMELLVHSYAIH